MIRCALVGALLALALASVPRLAAAAERFVDDGGRTVALPAALAHVVPAGPPATVDLLMLTPEKLAGLTRALTTEQAALLPAPVASLPAFGRLTARGGPGDLTSIRAARADLIIDIGDVTDRYRALADQVQQETGIPYVLIGGKLAETPATLRKLGRILDVSARAELLARYAEETLALLKVHVPDLPVEQRPSLFIARGSDGLAGDGGTAEVVALVGARSALSASGGGNNLSIEAVRTASPDIIVVTDRAFYADITHGSAWQGVAAVAAGRVYLAPAEPFGWLDEPPAMNRLIGLRWLARQLYPGRFDGDLRAETRRFYALFYQREASEAQLDRLLGSATPQR